MLCLNCGKDKISLSSITCPQCGVHLPSLMRDILPHSTLLNDKYRIDYPLGRGGFGITYLAMHVKTEQRLAVKEYYPKEHAVRESTTGNLTILQSSRAAYDRGLQRFLREAKILAKLNHPNIVRVQDFFEERETAYIVMELISGFTLRKLLEKQTNNCLSSDRVKDIFDAVVEALSIAHAESIYHLDLKPDNLLITPEGRVVLVDFGASKQGISSESQIAFTLAYAPLEVISGDEIGASSDIFSLGVMLYEMLTGKRPPDAIKRLSTNDWQPTELEQPWQNLVTEALQLQKENRPKDLKSWRSHGFNNGYSPRAVSASFVRSNIYQTVLSVKNKSEILASISTQVKTVRDLQAETLAISFREYILNLRKTFKIYFWDNRVKLSFFNFLFTKKRKAFEIELTEDFARYLDEKISEWSLVSEKQIHSSLAQLDLSLTTYGIDGDRICSEQLTQEIIPKFSIKTENNLSNREKIILVINYLLGIYALFLGNVGGFILAITGLTWKDIGINLIASTILSAFLGGIEAIVLIGLIIAAGQIELARREFLKNTNKKMLNSLAKIASDRQGIVYQSVKDIFDRYEKEVKLKLNK